MMSPTSDSANQAVRPASVEDVPGIYHLIAYHAVRGNLLPRSKQEIEQDIGDFYVIEQAGRVVACGALEIFSADLGEVRSLVVDDEYKKFGYGRRVTEHLIQQATLKGLRQVMALTYVPGFFIALGFKKIDFTELPEKVIQICKKCYKYNSCDETAVLLTLPP